MIGQLSWEEIFSSKECTAELIADFDRAIKAVVRISEEFDRALTELKKAEAFSRLGSSEERT